MTRLNFFVVQASWGAEAACGGCTPDGAQGLPSNDWCFDVLGHLWCLVMLDTVAYGRAQRFDS
jgi:hypothetical protein